MSKNDHTPPKLAVIENPSLHANSPSYPKKIRVGILFGGRSAEHEVSLLSAKSVIEAMDKEKYEPVLIGINKVGEWFLHEDLERCLKHADNAKLIHLQGAKENVALVATEKGHPLVNLSGASLECPLDVIFPVLHGPYGEDGTVQGLIKLANVPFVGAGVLASAVGMDKDVMKRLFRDAGLPVGKFITLTRKTFEKMDFETVEQLIGVPFFVKPANAGSSVGVAKIKNKSEFRDKVEEAFQYDHKILLEEFIPGREIECSVLGNEDPVASLPGEVIPQHEFYSYEAKYLDLNGALFEIPAKLSAEVIREIQMLAIKAYEALGCEGMARVDMFLTADGRIVLNEINTIPGFTKISMYPKMWAASGLSYPHLIDKLIELALERFHKENRIKTTVTLVDAQPVVSDLE